MRRPLLAVVLSGALITGPVLSVTGSTMTAAVVYAQESAQPPQQPPPSPPENPAQPQPTPTPQQPSPDIDITVTEQGRVWYASPVWIAIGAIALVVLIMLIVMAVRGRETTVVK